MNKQKIRKIMVDKDKCMGCSSCVLACMIHHSNGVNSIYDLDLENSSNNRNYVELDYKGNPVPLICNHCKEAQCVMACMSGSMSKNSKTGIVEHDPYHCVGCLMCVMSCPFGVLRPDKEGNKKILKCDMCVDLDEPACVSHCPTSAIYLVEVEAHNIIGD